MNQNGNGAGTSTEYQSVSRNMIPPEVLGTKQSRTGPQVMASVGSLLTDNVLPRPRNVPKSFYKKVREMRRDPTVSLARKLVVAPVMMAKWSYESTKDATEEMIEFIWDQMEPLRTDLLKTSFYGCIDYGWQSFEKVTSVDDQGRVVIQKLKPLLPDLTDILVYADTGEYAGLRQDNLYNLAGGAPLEIDLWVAETFLTSFDVEGTNWYGEPDMAIVEIAYDKWLQVERGADRYDRKISGAHWVVHYPIGTTPFNGVDTPNYDIATQLLRTLEASGQIIIPVYVAKMVSDLDRPYELPQWKIELISAQGGVTSFMDRLRYFDALKVRAMGLPERAVLEGQFGTKAEAQTHADLGITYMETRHAQVVAQVNQHIVNQLLRENWGEEAENAVYVQAAPIADLERDMIVRIYTALLGTPEGLASELSALDMEAMRDRLALPWKPETDWSLEPTWEEMAEQAAGTIAREQQAPTRDTTLVSLPEYDPSQQASSPWADQLGNVQPGSEREFFDSMESLIDQQNELETLTDPLLMADEGGQRWVTISGNRVLVKEDGTPVNPPKWMREKGKKDSKGFAPKGYEKVGKSYVKVKPGSPVAEHPAKPIEKSKTDELAKFTPPPQTQTQTQPQPQPPQVPGVQPPSLQAPATQPAQSPDAKTPQVVSAEEQHDRAQQAKLDAASEENRQAFRDLRKQLGMSEPDPKPEAEPEPDFDKFKAETNSVFERLKRDLFFDVKESIVDPDYAQTLHEATPRGQIETRLKSGDKLSVAEDILKDGSQAVTVGTSLSVPGAAWVRRTLLGPAISRVGQFLKGIGADIEQDLQLKAFVTSISQNQHTWQNPLGLAYDPNQKRDEKGRWIDDAEKLSDEEHLTKVFTKTQGLSPSEYVRYGGSEKDLQKLLRVAAKEIKRGQSVGVTGVSKVYEDEREWAHALDYDENEKLGVWLDSAGSRSLRKQDASGKSSKRLSDLLKIVSTAPKYAGTAYRGLELSQDDVAQFKVGRRVGVRSLESFSKKRAVAVEFSTMSGSTLRVPVVLKATVKDGRDLSGVNPGEAEVLVRRENFRVKSIKPVKLGSWKQDGFEVELE